MTVKERISFLFNSSILSDVTFIVGRDTQQQRIPAHRFVLSVGSAVFDAMFNSSLATRYVIVWLKAVNDQLWIFHCRQKPNIWP